MSFARKSSSLVALIVLDTEAEIADESNDNKDSDEEGEAEVEKGLCFHLLQIVTLL